MYSCTRIFLFFFRPKHQGKRERYKRCLFMFSYLGPFGLEFIFIGEEGWIDALSSSKSIATSGENKRRCMLRTLQLSQLRRSIKRQGIIYWSVQSNIKSGVGIYLCHPIASQKYILYIHTHTSLPSQLSLTHHILLLHQHIHIIIKWTRVDNCSYHQFQVGFAWLGKDSDFVT